VHRILVLLVCLGAVLPASAATGRILKVLPEYLDLKGRNSLTPSLYERDAYQVVLRENPAKRSGLRFYTQWKLRGPFTGHFVLRVELRGIAVGNLPRQMTLEKALEPKGGWFGHWTNLTLGGEEYKKFGEVTAWRVTLWEDAKLLGEQQSFLW
jgi:hypothetical protein